jgi:hypothetical protein
VPASASPSIPARLSSAIVRNRPALTVTVVEFAAACHFAWSHPANAPAAFMLLFAAANATLTLANGRIDEAWTMLRRLAAGARTASRRPVPSGARP